MAGLSMYIHLAATQPQPKQLMLKETLHCLLEVAFPFVKCLSVPRGAN